MNENNKHLPETFLTLYNFRKNDIFPSEVSQEQIIEEFFPKSFVELVQNLSDITGAFYGGMLKQIEVLYGKDATSQISKNFMYDLGIKTALKNMSAKPNLNSDLPAMAKILLGTVYTSSPEFSFEIKQWNNTIIEVLIKGIDRYHKAAQNFGIAEQLEWPTIKPFIQGICDAMKLNILFKMDIHELKDDSSCIYNCTISQK
ncbi:hypothetical protein [Chryseobacterium polytrichastri]|uniref:Haem-NO-binding n=1 Tax=Chryseobacterium polytrichastri TaxID=1302687 RepID=A0A1M7CUA2_9FLAO|nr:hypothetical protein [Chryseobacterium polytrichastri]SHL70795.1 hypothetical protein SAMN05444267_102319 [Chryseobacterium polytrichastri]